MPFSGGGGSDLGVDHQARQTFRKRGRLYRASMEIVNECLSSSEFRVESRPSHQYKPHNTSTSRNSYPGGARRGFTSNL
eukprot:2111733-Rhodomonas_salina.4